MEKRATGKLMVSFTDTFQIKRDDGMIEHVRLRVDMFGHLLVESIPEMNYHLPEAQEAPTQIIKAFDKPKHSD